MKKKFFLLFFFTKWGPKTYLLKGFQGKKISQKLVDPNNFFLLKKLPKAYGETATLCFCPILPIKSQKRALENQGPQNGLNLKYF